MTLATVIFGFAVLPLVLVLCNLALLRRPRAASPDAAPLSLLIPARNEAATLRMTLEAAVRDPTHPHEILVMDDASEDETPQIVEELARADARIRLLDAPPKPDGWNGKQATCHALSREAQHEVMLFIDADVVLRRGAVAALATLASEEPRTDLWSGIPHQTTQSFGEWLLIPLIHFLMFGYLTLIGARLSRSPSFGAGCGQLMLVRRRGYERAGGHAAIRASRHDGVKLPRAFRRAGLRTDLIDADHLATCRMYDSWTATVSGLTKNAHEGMATPRAIGVWTLLLGVGQVLPPLALGVSIVVGASRAVLLLLIAATAAGFVARAILALRFRQSSLSVLLHPVGVVALLCIQFAALIKHARGEPTPWKGRTS